MASSVTMAGQGARNVGSPRISPGHPMNWLRTMRPTRWAWMAFQAICTCVGLWAGLTSPSLDMARPLFVIFETVMGFAIGLTITVAWVLPFELFRYGLPSLVRRSVQKVRGGHTLRL